MKTEPLHNWPIFILALIATGIIIILIFRYLIPWVTEILERILA